MSDHHVDHAHASGGGESQGGFPWFQLLLISIGLIVFFVAISAIDQSINTEPPQNVEAIYSYPEGGIKKGDKFIVQYHPSGPSVPRWVFNKNYPTPTATPNAAQLTATVVGATQTAVVEATKARNLRIAMIGGTETPTIAPTSTQTPTRTATVPPAEAKANALQTTVAVTQTAAAAYATLTRIYAPPPTLTPVPTPSDLETQTASAARAAPNILAIIFWSFIAGIVLLIGFFLLNPGEHGEPPILHMAHIAFEIIEWTWPVILGLMAAGGLYWVTKNMDVSLDGYVFPWVIVVVALLGYIFFMIAKAGGGGHGGHAH
jgi:hypothetical protein